MTNPMVDLVPVITSTDAGCWIAGHEGWRSVATVVRIAVRYGMELPDADMVELDTFEAGDSTTDTVFDMSDEAETYLNTVTPNGFSFGWHDGEFFLMADEWWQDA